jgi:hypothetical protein
VLTLQVSSHLPTWPWGIIRYSAIDLKEVTNASLRDGLKKPNLFNKLGFGKRKYYEVYLAIDNNRDYHWYRQDKKGYWSHKPGHSNVRRVDAGGKLILNPAKANHNYNIVNYNDGGIFLWVKRR